MPVWPSRRPRVRSVRVRPQLSKGCSLKTTAVNNHRLWSSGSKVAPHHRNLKWGNKLLDHYQWREVPVVPQHLQLSKFVQNVASRNMIREPGVQLAIPFVTSATARDTTAVNVSPRLWQLLTLMSSTWRLHYGELWEPIQGDCGRPNYYYYCLAR